MTLLPKLNTFNNYINEKNIIPHQQQGVRPQKPQLAKPGQLEVRGTVAAVNIHQSLTMLSFTSPKKYPGGGEIMYIQVTQSKQ
jgi:hypothetical protein